MRSLEDAIKDFRDDDLVNEIHRQLTDIARAVAEDAPSQLRHVWSEEKKELVAVTTTDVVEFLDRIAWLGKTFDSHLKANYPELLIKK